MACKTHIAHIAHIAWARGRVEVQRLGAASMPGRRGRAMPGRFAENLDSCPTTGKKFAVVV